MTTRQLAQRADSARRTWPCAPSRILHPRGGGGGARTRVTSRRYSQSAATGPRSPRQQEGAMNETTIQELRGKLRGELITPADAAYDAARKVYNGMIDRRPALIARCADAADVMAGVDLRPRAAAAARGARRRLTTAPVSATCDGGLVIDLARHEGRPRRPDEPHRPGRRGRRVGRRRSRHPPLRAGGAQRLHLDHRRRRPDAGRGRRLSHAPLRPHHRQPPRGGRGPGRRASGHGQRARRTPTSSGPCAAVAATSAW